MLRFLHLTMLFYLMPDVQDLLRYSVVGLFDITNKTAIFVPLKVIL